MSAAAVAFYFLLGNCSPAPQEKQQETSMEDVRQQAGTALESTQDFMAHQKLQYLSDLELRLSEIDTHMAEMKKSAEQASGDLGPKMESVITDLQGKSVAVRMMVKELETAKDETWGELKAKTEVAMTDLDKAYEDSKSYLK